METITILVESEVAQLYREVTPKQQQKIQPLLNNSLKEILVNELTENKNNLNIIPNEDYPIYSPLNAFEAADTLLKLLKENKQND